MKSISFKVFDGRSIYSHRKCIRLNLDLEGNEEITTRNLSSFNESLVDLLPPLAKHRCSLDEENGLLKKLNQGAYLHHLCGHIAIALQNIAGLNVSFCSESKLGCNNYYTVYEYEYRNAGIEAGNIAVDIINSLIEKKRFNLSYRLEELKKMLRDEQVSSRKLNVSSGADKRHIPIVAITGTNGKTTTTRLIAYIISKAGFKVGMTTTGGIFINGHCVYEGDTTGPRSALTVLTNNEIDAAVLETARGGIIRNGLAYDFADVAVITNITDDHLGMDEIETMEDLANVKLLVGEAVKADGYAVINGDDNMSISMLNRIKSRLIVFSEDKNNEILINNIKNGGYGIYIDENNLCIKSNNTFVSLMSIEDIGITLKGALKYNVQNAMAACGALIGFGIDPAIIKEGLEAFQCNEELNPGRFNVFNIGGIRTVLDYGHNIDGYKSVLQGLVQMKHNKLIGVIAVPGDRLDRTTLEVGRIAGSYLNRIFIREDKDRRGRLPGEVAELLQEGVLSSGFSNVNLKIVLEEEVALDRALDSADPDDIVIIFFDEYAPILRLVKERIVKVIQEPSLA